MKYYIPFMVSLVLVYAYIGYKVLDYISNPNMF